MHTELSISNTGHHLLMYPSYQTTLAKQPQFIWGYFALVSTEKVCKRETQWLILRHLYLHLSVYPDDVGFSHGENLDIGKCVSFLTPDLPQTFLEFFHY